MNAISKQIRGGKYTEPYSHKHLTTKEVFSHEIYAEIKSLELEGKTEQILENYSSEILKANRFGYLIQQEPD